MRGQGQPQGSHFERLSWCCLPDSLPHTTHLPAFVRATTYYWEDYYNFV